MNSQILFNRQRIHVATHIFLIFIVEAYVRKLKPIIQYEPMLQHCDEQMNTQVRMVDESQWE